MVQYPSVVYLNGEFVASASARVSVFDRGFLFGDGIYEVMVQINGRFFYGDAHWKRLQLCLDKIDIRYEIGKLREAVPQLLAINELAHKDCLLYIQVTRGVAPRQHSFPANIQPSVLMYAIPKVLPKINEINAKVSLPKMILDGRDVILK